MRFYFFSIERQRSDAKSERYLNPMDVSPEELKPGSVKGDFYCLEHYWGR